MLPFTNKCTLCIFLTVILISVILTTVNVLELRHVRYSRDANSYHCLPDGASRRVVWMPQISDGNMKHVHNVLKRFGFSFGNETSDWEMLWSWNYPFQIYREHMLNLKPHQRVNHFPGSGYITTKNSLASSDIRNVPKAYKLPQQKEEFKRRVAAKPDEFWVQKSNTHRGIRIAKIDDMNLDAEGSFVQKFVNDPLLIDNRKFDIGIYAVLTSINPLRVYVLDSEALFRFCTDDYFPFAVSETAGYIVSDDYTPTWEDGRNCLSKYSSCKLPKNFNFEGCQSWTPHFVGSINQLRLSTCKAARVIKSAHAMPSLKPFYLYLGYSHKDSFNAYMKKTGHNPDKLWAEMYETIRDVYEKKEQYLITSAKDYKRISNFFEMVRFDFLVDARLNVFLMEVNMSPNLSSMRFHRNRLIYEQVIVNTLSLVGVARYAQNDWYRSSEVEREMMVADFDLVTWIDSDTSHDCSKDCEFKECRLSLPCLNKSDKMMLRDAYREHKNRMNMKRLLPRSKIQNDHHKPRDDEVHEDIDIGDPNRLMRDWFQAKCDNDVTWC